jgi:hypothetical protein
MKKQFQSKSILSVLLSLFTFAISLSQVTEAEKKLRELNSDSISGWKSGGIAAINLSQTSLTNWAAGGQSSLAVNGILSAYANLIKGKSAWNNTLDIGYGIIKQGKDAGYAKTDDKIEFLSKYGFQAFRNFYYSALLNFKTQMRPGYRYPDQETKISGFFAPAYLLVAIGLDYKPNPYLSAFIAPLTSKFTFVLDNILSDEGAFGVPPGEKSRTEIGGYLRAAFTKNDFKTEFLQNITFTTKLDLFSNYADKPQNIDVNWETLITLNVNKFISVNFNTNLLYDDNIKIPIDRNGDGTIESTEAPGPRTQFKEILGVGFSFKF